MANMARRFGEATNPSTILMMKPTGGQPTFELAQYGDHNQDGLNYQVEPRLDRYQVKQDGFEGQYKPDERMTMQNTGFQNPSERAMGKMSKVGQTRPMLDEQGRNIGEVVQFSAVVKTDENGFATGIDAGSIAPPSQNRERLPAGANLLQDIAKKANNEFHTENLRHEREGGQHAPQHPGQPGKGDHDVVARANYRGSGPFDTPPPAPEKWTKYAGDPSQSYTRDEQARPDNPSIREKAAASFGAHNPVKNPTRNRYFDGNDTPSANREQPSGGFGASAGGPFGGGAYDYQTKGAFTDTLPAGVKAQTGLGHELASTQLSDQRRHEADMAALRDKNRPFGEKLKDAWRNVENKVVDLGRSMGVVKPITTPTNPVQRPGPEAQYRDGAFGQVKTHEAVDNSPQKGSPFGEGFSSSAPRFGEGSKMAESAKFGDRGGFGYEAPPKASEPTNNPFTSSQSPGFGQSLNTRPFKTQGGFSQRNSPFGESEKDDGPSFG